MFSKVECHNVNSSIKSVIKKECYAHLFYREFIKIVNIYAIICDGPYTQNIYRKFVELKQTVISFLFFLMKMEPDLYIEADFLREKFRGEVRRGWKPSSSELLFMLTVSNLQFKYHSGNIPLPFLE